MLSKCLLSTSSKTIRPWKIRGSGRAVEIKAIAFAAARKPYRQSICSGIRAVGSYRISVTKRSYASPISKVDDHIIGTPNDGFLLHILNTLFRLSRVLLDLKKCIGTLIISNRLKMP